MSKITYLKEKDYEVLYFGEETDPSARFCFYKEGIVLIPQTKSAILGPEEVKELYLALERFADSGSIMS